MGEERPTITDIGIGRQRHGVSAVAAQRRQPVREVALEQVRQGQVERGRERGEHAVVVGRPAAGTSGTTASGNGMRSRCPGTPSRSTSSSSPRSADILVFVTTISSPVRFGGVTEVADELGVTRQQVTNLRQRPDFPEPVALLAMGEVWDLDVIRRWADSGLRRAVGRPSGAGVPVVVGRRFVLGQSIGSGGFSVVYRATDVLAATGDQVAIKVLQPQVGLDATAVARFLREMKLMSGLSHANVMTVLASGTDDQAGVFYAMPVAIGSLADGLKQGRMSEADILAVMHDVCAGLAYIHSQGVLHRDLKPDNILRTQGGQWAIADFGLARAVADSASLTETGQGLGTRLYMAPEQLIDAGHVTVAADIYSAGKVMQQMVTGTLPVTGDVPQGRLARVVRRAISPDPQQRYRDAGSLLAAMQMAVVPGYWESSAQRAVRLRQQLAAGLDAGAVGEIMRWTDEAGQQDLQDFTIAVSAVPAWVAEQWWRMNRDNFSRMFRLFTQGMEGVFPYSDCDPVADFAQRAVLVTQDMEILRDAICGLALLGFHHDRWHVRDVATWILQWIRIDAYAASALEGLQAAGAQAAEWATAYAVPGALHPILSAEISQMRQSPPPADIPAGIVMG